MINILHTLLLFTCFAVGGHPVHISMTSINYNAQNKGFDITMKLYVDDFETIVNQKYGVALQLGTPTEHPQATNTAIKYMSEHFSLRIDNKKYSVSDFKFMGKQLADHSVWFNFFCQTNTPINQIALSNSLMSDMFTDQTNLVIVTYSGQEKGYSLNLQDTTIIIDAKAPFKTN